MEEDGGRWKNMGGDGRTWGKMEEDGGRWKKMGEDGRRWGKMEEDGGRWKKMGEDGRRRGKMDEHGGRWKKGARWPSGLERWLALANWTVPAGSNPTADNFASELWQFRLPRFASVFRMIH